MNINIIALDIDDCILPTDQNYFGQTDDSIQILEINLKRLVMILEKYNINIFITSDWYGILTFDEKGLKLKDRGISPEKADKGWYALEIKAFNLIKKYLEEFIIGLSCGNRDTDIEVLKEYCNVIIIDDMDLKHHESDNCIYCYTHGFIDGRIGYQIHKFLGENK